jgi:hypothetical protein
VVASWEDCRGRREVTASTSLHLKSLLVSSFRARARDLKGNETFSRALKVTFTSEAKEAAALKESLERALAMLAEILRREETLAKSTSALAASAGSSGPEDHPAFRRDALGLASEQDSIRSSLARLVRDLRAAPSESLGARRKLARAAADLMPGVGFQLLSAAEARSGTRETFVRKALAGERRIIVILLEALGVLESLARDPGKARTEEGMGSRQAELAGIRRQLRDLLAKLEDFARDQRELVAGTQALADKATDDFTEEDSRALDELVAAEERWGKLLEEKGTDLSKVAPQDMSLGVLCEEVVELVEEIDLARDYLKGKSIELAVPLEQSGVALSEKLETNIERWLSRDRDRLKWILEEPVEDTDVPLADLPSELEDIVGELIDREDLLTEETEDVTSSWLDSMDDGVGWDAMDGPISNMSAKGVTGNLQPNDMEIGGRSGEGRSGKSQGQFVEETASGKGGRQTPSRSTADPFESGEVKDTGRDATGGSTGGGKLSGAGQEGLRGPPSPELDRKMGALAGKQTALREAAEKLDLALERRRYYSQDLQKALDWMRVLEEALASRRPYNYEAVRKQIVSDLRGLRRVASGEIDRKLEAAATPPGERDAEPMNAAAEEAPREYQDLIREYYRALGRVDAAGAPAAKRGKP